MRCDISDSSHHPPTHPRTQPGHWHLKRESRVSECRSAAQPALSPPPHEIRTRTANAPSTPLLAPRQPAATSRPPIGQSFLCPSTRQNKTRHLAYIPPWRPRTPKAPPTRPRTCTACTRKSRRISRRPATRCASPASAERPRASTDERHSHGL
jgi:hypothetical protein